MTMCSSETVAVFCGCTVYNGMDYYGRTRVLLLRLRRPQHRDWEQKIELLPEVSSGTCFFFTQQRTPHFRKLLLLLLLGHQPKLPLCDPFCLFENTGNFLELKTLVAEKCIECDERDSVVTIRSTTYPAAIVKSLSVCTWKKLQKPQICAQAVGIMYNTYGNFFVLAGYIVCTVFEKKKY